MGAGAGGEGGGMRAVDEPWEERWSTKELIEKRAHAHACTR